MKIVNANAIELAEADILKKIELCGRICYKSEDKITDTSCFTFVQGLIKRQHYAMTEHAYFCLSVTERLAKRIKSLGHGTFLHVTLNGKEERYLISGNVRAWINLFNPYIWKEEEWADICKLQTYVYMAMDEKTYNVLFNRFCTIPTRKMDCMLSQKQILKLPNLTKEEALAHLYLTALFTCDRGVTHELVRHRPSSFAQESTRYCNYSKGKFGEEISVITPADIVTEEHEFIWQQAMENAEHAYFRLLALGCTPQTARSVLPTCTKAELVLTANLAEWQHIINLRYHGTTGAPHPDCKKVMSIWYDYVSKKEGYKKWIQ